MNYALIIAGGSGNRMGQDIPKQFMHVFSNIQTFMALLWCAWLAGKRLCSRMLINSLLISSNGYSLEAAMDRSLFIMASMACAKLDAKMMIWC